MIDLENVLRDLDGEAGLFICKTHKGFSCVLIDRQMYLDIILRDHHNAPTLKGAIRKILKERQKRDGQQPK